MPRAKSTLFSLRARGRIGGHRRKRVLPLPLAGLPVSAHTIQTIKDTSGYKTISSNVWTDLDPTNLSITLPSPDGYVLILLQSVLQSSGDNTHAFLDLTVDGVRQGGSYGLLTQHAYTSGERHSFLLHYLVHLTGTNIVIRPQWKRQPTGLWYLYADIQYTPCLFSTLELL